MRIVALVHTLSDATFAEVDCFAWVQAWQTERRWHTHTYRDKRFDALIACRVCAELGHDPKCPSCRGTGRVDTLEPPGSRR
jgi:hypothetical protein